jgi:site-specific recombinase XerD
MRFLRISSGATPAHRRGTVDRIAYLSSDLEEGAEIVSIKELMGHSSIESSERYAKISNQRVKHVYLQTIKKVIDKTRV